MKVIRNKRRAVKASQNPRCRRPIKASSIMAASDYGTSIIVNSKAYVDITEDNYENGADMNIINQWDFDVRGEYSSIEQLIEAIADRSYVFSNNINDYSFGDGALHTSAMVNADNEVPSEYEYEAWKRGEESLYIADMYLYLGVGSVHDMTNEEAQAFGIKEIW